jgi:hypothetical protein
VRRLERTSFLTANEKREAVGYEPAEAGGELPGAPTVPRPPGLTPLLAPAFKYSPDQPRVPRGHTDGGQWTDGGGGNGASASDDDRVISDARPDGLAKPGARLAQAESREKYQVIIEEEDARGGHTIRDHVGKSDAQLLSALEQEVIHTPGYSFYKEAQGSFLSRESANDFVNRILEGNQPKVDAVASGIVEEAWIEERFGYPTGKQAFRPGPEEPLYVRPTFKVGVLIRPDRRSTRGYSVHTAYPLNDSNTGGGYRIGR